MKAMQKCKVCINHNVNKSANWHCGRHTLICKKKLIKKT